MSWFERVARLRLTESTSHALRLDVPGPMDVVPLLCHRGLWWSLPLLRMTGIDVIALRMMPGVALAESPVLRLTGPTAVTIASSPRALMSALIPLLMTAGPELWAAVRALDVDQWKELEELQRELGGGPLAPVRRVVEERQRQVPSFTEDPRARSQWLADIWRTLDPQRPGGAAWSAARASQRFVELEAREPSTAAPSVERLVAAWDLLAEPNALDSGRSDVDSLLLHPDFAVSLRILMRARRLLADHRDRVPPALKADPMWALIEAVAADSLGYDVSTEMMVAAAYDEEAGEPERAFTMLTNQSYWNHVRSGRDQEAPLDAAEWLAEKSGWAELAQHLSVVRALRAAGPTFPE